MNRQQIYQKLFNLPYSQKVKLLEDYFCFEETDVNGDEDSINSYFEELTNAELHEISTQNKEVMR